MVTPLATSPQRILIELRNLQAQKTEKITCIGIIGAGTQAKKQLEALQYVTSCRDVIVWGRNREKAIAFSKDPSLLPFNITLVESIDELTQNCNLIVTTTPSKDPLLFGHQIQKGTHITAVGADGKGKQELDQSVFSVADTNVVDSVLQCSECGDISYAKDLVDMNKVQELGSFISAPKKREKNVISIADLTGISIIDLQKAKYIYHKLSQSR